MLRRILFAVVFHVRPIKAPAPSELHVVGPHFAGIACDTVSGLRCQYFAEQTSKAPLQTSSFWFGETPINPPQCEHVAAVVYRNIRRQSVAGVGGAEGGWW